MPPRDLYIFQIAEAIQDILCMIPVNDPQEEDLLEDINQKMKLIKLGLKHG